MLTIAATVLVGFPTIAPAIADGLVTVRIGANYDLPNGLPISAFQAKAVFCRTVWGATTGWPPGSQPTFAVLDVPTFCEAVDLSPSQSSTTASLPGGFWFTYLALREAIEPDTPGLWQVAGPFTDQLTLVAGTRSDCEFGRGPVCRPEGSVEVSRVERISLRTDGTPHDFPPEGAVLPDFCDWGDWCTEALSADGRHAAFTARDVAIAGTEQFPAEGFAADEFAMNCSDYYQSRSRSIYLWDEGDTAPHRLPTLPDLTVTTPWGEAVTLLACPDAPSLSADGRYVVFRDRFQTAWERAGVPAALNGPRVNPDGPGQRLLALTRHVYAFDRDADRNGVLDEVGPGRTAVTLIGRPATPGSVTPNAFTTEWADQAGLLPVHPVNGDEAVYPTVSTDGRYVAWVTVADRNLTGGRVLWHDRDADADGAFDEPGQVETRVIMTPTGNWTAPEIAGVGPDGETIITTPERLDPAYPAAVFGGSQREVAFRYSPTTGTFAALVPPNSLRTFSEGNRVDCGADTCLLSVEAMSSRGRYLTGRVLSPASPWYWSPALVRIDRDPDGDGILDEPGASEWLSIDELSPRFDRRGAVADSGAVVSAGAITNIGGDRESWLRWMPGEGITVLGQVREGRAEGTTAHVSADGRRTLIATPRRTQLPSTLSLSSRLADWYLVTVDPQASELDATLTTDAATVEPGASAIDISDIPSDRLRALNFDPLIAPGGTKLRPGGTRLRPGGTRLRPGGTRLRPGGTRLRDAGSTPLAEFAVRLAEVDAARDAPLTQIVVKTDGGWPALLAGTALAGIPLQSVTVGDLLDLLVAGVPSGSDLGSLTMGDLDLADSPLAAISAVGLELGSTPVRDLVTVGGTGWCAQFAAVTGETCEVQGLPVGSPRTLMELDLDPTMAKVLDAYPILRRVDIAASSIALAAADAPVLSTALDDINVAVTRLGAIDLAAAVVNARSSLGAVAVSALSTTQRARTVVCDASFDCATGTLAGALDAGALRPGSVLGDVEGRAGGTAVGDLGSAVLDGVLVDDIVRGRLDAVDFPWENLDLTLAGLQEFADSPNTVDVDLAINASGAAGTSATADVTLRLPPGFRIDPQSRGGVAPLRVTGQFGAPSTATVKIVDREYTATDGTLRLSVGPLALGEEHHLVVRVIAALRLGDYEFGARVRMGGRTATPAPAAVEVVEPTDAGSTPGAAQPIAANRLVFGYFGGAADIDLYSYSAAGPDEEVSVRLTNLGDDGDLALFGPRRTTGSQIGSRRVGAQPQPIADLSQDVSAALSATDPGADAVGTDGPGDSVLVGSSAAPGVTDAEQALGTGVQFVQVSAFDRYAARRDPYMVRIRAFAAPSKPACAAVTHPHAGAAGAMPDLSTLPADLATVILVAEERLGDAYPASEVAALRARLDALAADPSVRGVVIPIEASDPGVLTGYPNVRGALDALEQSPCDVDRANTVVERITKLVDAIRTGSLPGVDPHLDLANVVVVGSDSIIPMARLEDSTRTGNEETYADAFDLGSPIGAALASRRFLSDAPYGDLDPIPWANRRLYVEDLAVGRLVETPDQIGDQIDAYLNQPDHALDPSKALVASYDWMTSGAMSAQAALGVALTQANGGAEVDVRSLEDGWSAANLLAGAGSIGAVQPTVTGLYMHADHRQGISGAGDSFTPADLAAALPAGSKFVFSMGCHAGLNDPDTAGDFPEAMAAGQAVYLASTGYGLGDDSGIQLHDRLVRYLAGRLNGASTIGDALVGAKQDYFSTQGVYGDYDDKVLSSMTLYGLPMYRVGDQTTVTPPADVTPTPYGSASASGSAAPAPRFRSGATPMQLVAFSPGNGIERATFGYSTTGGTGQAPLGGALVERTNADGRWFEVAGSLPLAVPGRPVQPRVDRDVTARRNGALLPAHGALITSLTEQATIGGFDAAWSRATVDAAAAAPELVAGDVAFPDRFATITTYSDPSGARTDPTTPKLRQRIVVAPGRFVSDATAAPGVGTQSLFSAVAGDVLYSFSEDYTEPRVGEVVATVDPTAHSVTFGVDATDASGIAGVVVLVRDDTGWHRLDLDQGSGDTWAGSRSVQSATGAVGYFVQVVDAAGNVATRSAKGAFAAAAATPAVTADDVTVLASRTSAVTAMVTVVLDRPAIEPVLVDWVLRDGTARVLAGDYAGASGTLRFEPGETSRTIEVVIAEATGGEDDEFLTVDLSAPSGATLATGSVRIDVVSPESVAAKGISVSDAATPEGDLKNGTLRFVVSLDAPATTPVTVQIATEDGTATGAAKPTTPGVDYKILTPKTLTFLPGQVAKPVSVLVVPDLLAEGDETVRLVVSNATGMGIGRSAGTGTIRDDDPVTGNPARTGDAVIVEGDAKARPVFVAVRFATPLAAPTTVTYTTRDGSATGAAKPKGVPGDYLIRARSVALRAGATSFVIPITILPDTAHEGFESFDVVVDTPDGPITATVTIHDDE